MKPQFRPEDMRVLRDPSSSIEDKERSQQYLAFMVWFEHFKHSHGRDPNRWEMRDFITQLNERSWTSLKSPEALVSLLDEETKIRELARRICDNEMLDFDKFVIYLLPSEGGKTLIQGASPSIVEIGFRISDPDFKTHLRQIIRYAVQLYRPSKLIRRSKLYEYKRDIKRLHRWDGVEAFPLVPEHRLRVEEYRMVRVFDQLTGESVIRTEKAAEGMFHHYKSSVHDRLVMDGKIDISRKLIAKGLLKEEEDEVENDG